MTTVASWKRPAALGPITAWIRAKSSCRIGLDDITLKPCGRVPAFGGPRHCSNDSAPVIMQIENSGKSNPLLARVAGDSMGSVHQNNAIIAAVFDALHRSA